MTSKRSCSARSPLRFRVELERVYESLLESPQLYPTDYKNFHRALLRRFPYPVFYVVDPPILLVIGVVHQAGRGRRGNDADRNNPSRKTKQQRLRGPGPQSHSL
jgi:hypothetical protein